MPLEQAASGIEKRHQRQRQQKHEHDEMQQQLYQLQEKRRRRMQPPDQAAITLLAASNQTSRRWRRTRRSNSCPPMQTPTILMRQLSGDRLLGSIAGMSSCTSSLSPASQLGSSAIDIDDLSFDSASLSCWSGSDADEAVCGCAQPESLELTEELQLELVEADLKTPSPSVRQQQRRRTTLTDAEAELDARRRLTPAQTAPLASGGAGAGAGAGGRRRRRRRHSRSRRTDTVAAAGADTDRDGGGGSMSLSEFLRHELALSADVYMDPFVPRQKVYNFFRIPPQIEKLMIFGFLVCLDSFLFLFTALPLRLLLMLRRLMEGCTLSPAQNCDLLRGVLMFSCFVLLSLLNISFSSVYHFVRSQNLFKLYVLFNILQIFDKLCCSFGEDVLDALYSNASARLLSRRTLLDLAVSTVYITIHSLVLYFQVVALNVAINSSNSALVSLLISNNFVELKSSVFKKYSHINLFQISASDIVERFQLVIYVIVILFANLSNLSWHFAYKWFIQAAQLAALLLCMEMVVDWIKHGFITKFNNFPATVYAEFVDVLAADFAKSRNLLPTRLLDSSHAVSRRIGFVSMPMACVMLRGIWQIVFSVYAMQAMVQVPLFFVSVAALLYTCLLLVKLMLSVYLSAAASNVARHPPDHISKYTHVGRYAIFKSHLPQF